MKGANRQAKDKLGRTPYDLAKSYMSNNTSDTNDNIIFMERLIDYLVITL